MPEQSEIDRLYDLCKQQASVDGAFPEPLMQAWFQSAFDLCAAMVDFYPPRQIEEKVIVRPDGTIRLSYWPSSDVKFYAGYRLILTLPKTLERSMCDPALCCYCDLTVRYTIGEQTCGIPPRFAQAVMRLFAYMCENRGDSEMDEHILKKSGAFAFIAPDLLYAV